MTLTLIFVVFVAVAGGVFAVGAALFAPASGIGARLNGLLTGRERSKSEHPISEHFDRVLEPLSKALPKSPEELGETRLLLMRAGYRDSRHVQIYLGLRVMVALLFFAAVIATGLAIRGPILLLAAPFLGYLLPRFFLKRLIKRRQERIQLALPDALDLAIICVESGLGLDQALNRVGIELKTAHPELSDELTLLTLEMRAGKTRAEALRNFAKRVDIDDIRAFVSVLIQTDRFGTSVASALRVHSDASRMERRQRAEEKAAKTTIKMIPVLVFFIFPVMFFVILGPIVIAFIRDIKPNLH